MFFAALEILSQLIIFLLPETLLKNHQLLDIFKKREFSQLILILMVPEEVMMKLWLEELSPTPELSIS